jgi:hypothetical protein
VNMHPDPRYRITEDEAERMRMACLEADPTINIRVVQHQDGWVRLLWKRHVDGFSKNLLTVRKAAALVGCPAACEACTQHAIKIGRPQGRVCLDVRRPPWSEDCGLDRERF